jgi:hypothetical protein
MIETGPWLIQINPTKWDINSYIKDGHVLNSVSVYMNAARIHDNDPFILWLSGSDGGAIGWGRFYGEVGPNLNPNSDNYWLTKGRASTQKYFPIRMEEFFLENPIPHTKFKADPIFSNSGIITLPRGGNAFSITDAEWAVFVRLLQERELNPPNKDLLQSLPSGNENPQRKLGSPTNNIVRILDVADFIKKLHAYRCQFCGTTLITKSGGYSEGAHIKPLGGDHAGPDIIDNILSLCANCHILFDKGVLFLDSELENVLSVIDKSFKSIFLKHPAHSVSKVFTTYHREQIAGVK